METEHEAGTGSTFIVELSHAWNRFWFTPASPRQLLPLRVAICVVVGLWWCSFFGELSLWFGDSGILNTRLAARLVAFEETPRWQHWSPLWFTDQLWVYQAWVGVGALLSLFAALGLGGRLSLLALWLLSIAWVHRITWLQGALEPALIAMVGYLVVAPGASLLPAKKQESERAPTSSDPSHWLCGVARRLIQVHWWLLLAAGLLMQLGGLVWWRGEAVWWLASSGRSHLLSIESLRNSPTLVNALTHGIILVQALTLWLITVPAARPLGMVLGVLTAAAIGLIADQLLYGLLLAACLLAFRRPVATD